MFNRKKIAYLELKIEEKEEVIERLTERLTDAKEKLDRIDKLPKECTPGAWCKTCINSESYMLAGCVKYICTLGNNCEHYKHNDEEEK